MEGAQSNMLSWLIKVLSQYCCNTKGINKLNIVTYHRVSNGADSTNPKNIQYTEFTEQISWLKKHFTVLPLPLALKLSVKNSLPKNAVCITVDDGYKDSYDIIFKILQKESITASFFISTEGLEYGSLWDERIHHAIFSASSSIESIELLDVPYLMRGEKDRINTRYKLTEIAKYMKLVDRNKLIEVLYQQCQVTNQSDSFLTAEQIKEMHTAGMTIGAHTHSHPILAQEDAACAYQQIKQSKEILEKIIAHPIKYFAYPNGKLGQDFTLEHIEMVEEIGFNAALSTDWGSLSDMAQDRFKIKRFTPWDKTELMFSLRLALNYRK
jgi:peptidoglycan/xylan/chitin deacetylase (PgdA/CDA1 family)